MAPSWGQPEADMDVMHFQTGQKTVYCREHAQVMIPIPQDCLLLTNKNCPAGFGRIRIWGCPHDDDDKGYDYILVICFFLTLPLVLTVLFPWIDRTLIWCVTQEMGCVTQHSFEYTLYFTLSFTISCLLTGCIMCMRVSLRLPAIPRYHVYGTVLLAISYCIYFSSGSLETDWFYLLWRSMNHISRFQAAQYLSWVIGYSFASCIYVAPCIRLMSEPLRFFARKLYRAQVPFPGHTLLSIILDLIWVLSLSLTMPACVKTDVLCLLASALCIQMRQTIMFEWIEWTLARILYPARCIPSVLNKNRQVNNGVLLTYLNTAGKKSGPAINDGDLSDIVYALVCVSPHIYMTAFVNRTRSGFWPKKETLTAISKFPSALVGAGHKFSTTQLYEWRHSYSILELILSHDMPPWVKQAYRAFKYTVKVGMERAKQPISGDGRNKLCTYHLKTVLFWELEDMMAWEGESPFKLMQRLLTRLNDYLAQGIFPNYFIPECNLIDTLTETVRGIYIPVIMKIQESSLSYIIRSPVFPSQVFGGYTLWTGRRKGEELLRLMSAVRQNYGTTESQQSLDALRDCLICIDTHRERKGRWMYFLPKAFKCKNVTEPRNLIQMMSPMIPHSEHMVTSMV